MPDNLTSTLLWVRIPWTREDRGLRLVITQLRASTNIVPQIHLCDDFLLGCVPERVQFDDDLKHLHLQ
jgi:hypothetical protein